MGASSELVKLYYRIGEVSQIVGVQPHVLRYWETEFRTIRPQKSHKGQRVYSRRDVEKLLRVKDLLKNQGFTIAGAKKKLRDPEPEASPPLAEAAPVMTAEPAAPAQPLQALQAQPLQALRAQPLQAPAPQASAVAAASWASREKMRDALMSLREEIATMLDDLDSPPRRPKLPTFP